LYVSTAVIVALLGVLVGAVNRIFATRLRLNLLIVTLGMMSIVSGSALILIGGLTKPLMTPGFNWTGQGLLFGVPGQLILMIVTYLVLSVILARTRFGRFIYATWSAAPRAGSSRYTGRHHPGITGRNHPVTRGRLRRNRQRWPLEHFGFRNGFGDFSHVKSLLWDYESILPHRAIVKILFRV
jgi:hypothetical protein